MGGYSACATKRISKFPAPRVGLIWTLTLSACVCMFAEVKIRQGPASARRDLVHEDDVNCLAVSPDGTCLASEAESSQERQCQIGNKKRR